MELTSDYIDKITLPGSKDTMQEICGLHLKLARLYARSKEFKIVLRAYINYVENDESATDGVGLALTQAFMDGYRVGRSEALEELFNK